MSLTRDLVDLKENFVRLEPENCKTNEGRVVPLHRELLKMLRAMPRGLPGVRIFTRNGKPIKCVREGFEAACRKAGLEDFTFHDLRHTFESRGLDRGMSPANMMEIQGHSSIPFSLQHYFHGRDEKKLTDVELLVPLTVGDERKGERLPH